MGKGWSCSAAFQRRLLFILIGCAPAARRSNFYDVITQGYGTMYSFADRVQPG